jgi:hypothetical protein
MLVSKVQERYINLVHKTQFRSYESMYLLQLTSGFHLEQWWVRNAEVGLDLPSRGACGIISSAKTRTTMQEEVAFAIRQDGCDSPVREMSQNERRRTSKHISNV